MSNHQKNQMPIVSPHQPGSQSTSYYYKVMNGRSTYRFLTPKIRFDHKKTALNCIKTILPHSIVSFVQSTIFFQNCCPIIADQFSIESDGIYLVIIPASPSPFFWRI